MTTNFDLFVILIKESIELFGVYFIWIWFIPRFKVSKWNKNLLGIVHRESLIRLLIILTLSLQLAVTPIIALLTNSKGFIYDIIFLRTGDIGSARVSTQLLIFVLFITIMFLENGIHFTKYNPYFASAFSLLMSFLHELVWQLFYIIRYFGMQNEYYSLVQLLSYVEATIILSVICYRLRPNIFRNYVFLIGIDVWLGYMFYWYLVGLPITVYDATYKIFTQTQYYQSLVVGEYEYFSWFIIFSIFLITFVRLKYSNSMSSIFK